MFSERDQARCVRACKAYNSPGRHVHGVANCAGQESAKFRTLELFAVCDSGVRMDGLHAGVHTANSGPERDFRLTDVTRICFFSI